MEISWLSLIPPLIVIISAIIIKNINISLLLGIASAGLIATDYSLANSALLIGSRAYEQMNDIEKIYLYTFLIVIAALISLFNHTGCINAFALYVTKHIKSARAIQTSSTLISFTLFIDDYLSILTTGFIMTPLTDRFGISRQKLAFLVHSLAGPVVILAPISSWVGAITLYMYEAGIDPKINNTIHILADPYFLYLETIPFIFYSFLIIASIWFIIHNDISYGPMAAYEQGQKLVTTECPLASKAHKAYLSDLFVPIIVLIIGTFCGILYDGNYYLCGGNASFLQAIQQATNLNLILCIASIIALIVGIKLSLLHKTLTFGRIPTLLHAGIDLMYSVIIMLFLASIFGIMLKSDIYTGNYLATTLLSSIPIALFPTMFFIATVIVTIAAGGAWAAIALMLPIALPMLTTLMQLTTSTESAHIPILLPLLGAIFSGAVCGDNISPICGSTVMTASSTGVTPMEHAYTQIFYVFPALICTIIAFLISGYLINYPLWINCLCSLSISITLCFSMLWMLNKKSGALLASTSRKI